MCHWNVKLLILFPKDERDFPSHFVLSVLALIPKFPLERASDWHILPFHLIIIALSWSISLGGFGANRLWIGSKWAFGMEMGPPESLPYGRACSMIILCWPKDIISERRTLTSFNLRMWTARWPFRSSYWSCLYPEPHPLHWIKGSHACYPCLTKSSPTRIAPAKPRQQGSGLRLHEFIALIYITPYWFQFKDKSSRNGMRLVSCRTDSICYSDDVI